RSDVVAPLRRLRELLSFRERHVSLEEHRQVDGVCEVAGRRLGVGHEQPQRGGQCERQRDHEQREQGGERATHEPAERAQQGLQMTTARDPDTHRYASTEGNGSAASPWTWPFSSTITRWPNSRTRW